jgi:hypothetical protein
MTLTESSREEARKKMDETFRRFDPRVIATGATLEERRKSYHGDGIGICPLHSCLRASSRKPAGGVSRFVLGARPRRVKKGRAKKSDVKAPKRRRFVAGLIAGKSMRRAALDAGYTRSMANNAGAKITPGTRAEFQQELARKVPHGKLIKLIADGLNARETKLAQFEGQYTDQRQVIDFSERRRYAELALKIFGYLKEMVELSSSEDAQLNFNLDVHFVDGEPGAGEKTEDAALGISFVDREPGDDKQ